MRYVIMNVGTEMLYRKRNHVSNASYPTERGAKNACSRLNKEYGECTQWVVMSADEWNARPVKMKKVRNLMSGEEMEIPVDTPRCCDPSSELYWTM